MNLRHTSLLSFFKVMEKLKLEPKWFPLSRSNSSSILVLVWMTLVLEKLARFKIILKILNIYIYTHTYTQIYIYTHTQFVCWIVGFILYLHSMKNFLDIF